jgi:transcription elongation factor GreB
MLFTLCERLRLFSVKERHPGHDGTREPLQEDRKYMSRAFIKNDAVDDCILIPPRAPLPPGTINYVTPRGIAMLREELAGLEAERARAECINGSDETERTRLLASFAQRIAEIVARIESAKVIVPHTQMQDEVRFGTTVTVRTLTGKNPGEERRLTIVGVDEAEPSTGRVSFISPIASAILGRQVGETTSLQTAKGESVLEILAVTTGEDGL